MCWGGEVNFAASIYEVRPPRSKCEHFVGSVCEGHASALVAASIFHFGTYSVPEAKAYMAKAGLLMRVDG
jgi:imidazole glycerol phosphate synthase subunit HisF